MRFHAGGRHHHLQIPLRPGGGRPTEAAVAVLTDALQLALNGAMEGAVLAVPAIGFNAVYAVMRFANFAVGSIATIGAFAGWIANSLLGWPIAPSLLAAFLAAGIVGVVADDAALRPLRRAGPPH